MQPAEWKINMFCTHLFDDHKSLILLVADRRILRGFFHTFLGCPSRQPQCPLFPQKRTFVCVAAMSALCQ
jgi:hypothetical protein